MSMSATPRAARLSSSGEVVAILVATAGVWLVLVGALVTLVFTVLLPAVQFSGRSQIPADMPVYPGASLESAFSSTSPGCTTVQAGWSSTANADSVVTFYQQQLAQGPWTLVQTKPVGNATLLYFRSTSGPDRAGYIEIQPLSVPLGTQITLTLDKARSVASTCHTAVGVTG